MKTLFFVRTFFIYICIISVVLGTRVALATPGVPEIISYQGRLTDQNGILLGGTGTTYYFKFSIWDSATVGAGTRLWPTSAPTALPLSVTDGVFDVNIGDTVGGYPDALEYDFQTNDAVYLQVEVSPTGSTFETLGPRPRITSSSTAINSKKLDGLPGSYYLDANNLSNFFTRSLTTPLTGFVSTVGTISSADTFLSAIEKLSGNLQTAGQISSVFGRTGAITAVSGDYTTDQVTEATNLYYTQGRFDTAFGLKTTTNLSEGTNLYYTDARFDTRLAAKSTSDLIEGTNLYFRDDRARAALSAVGPIVYDDVIGVISVDQADAVTDGYLSSTDWSTFADKQNAITTGTSAQYLRGDLTLATFPTAITAFTNDAGYIAGNDSITLSGDISGSGTTAITATIGADKVTNAMLAGSITASKLVGTDIVTLGTITTGTWNGSPVTDGYITSAATWNSKQNALTFSTGLTNTSGTITNNLSTGISGGQSVIGGTASGNSLTLSSTTNATKGSILFGTSSYNESVNTLGIGATALTTSRVSIADTTLAGSGALAGTLLDLTQTWNTSGTPTAIKLNITDTASNANSNLMELKVGGVSRVTVNKTGATTIRSTTANESGVLSAELLASGGWTSTGWTGSNPFTHTVGNTNVLSNTFAAVVNTFYQIAYTITGRTAGSVTIALGGQSVASINATGTFGPRATTTGNFTVTPTTDFDGTITLSVKSITSYPATFSITDNTGAISFAVRSSLATLSNTAVGSLALRQNTTGIQNSAVGVNALQNNTTGFQNTAYGLNSLLSNTTGTQNTAQGANALQNNTTAIWNTANGVNALQFNTTGFQNTAVGVNALVFNTTGNNSSAVGFSALLNTTGGNNTGQGVNAGRTNTTGTNNTFVGFEAGFNASQITSATNSMALGNGAFTTASNQVVIGNTSITSIGLGMVPATTVKLDLSDTVLAGSGALAGTLLNLAQTWNTSGTPTAIRLNVTDTASNIASNLMELQVGGVSRLRVDKAGATTIRSTVANESGVLSAELLASGGWTSTGWTGSNPFTHTVGNTNVLSNTFAAAINTYYQITYTITGRTAGSVTIALGGQSIANVTATGTFGPRATTTGNFTVTPTTDFDGAITFSVKSITLYPTTFSVTDNTGAISFAVRSSLATLNNTSVGKNSLRQNTTGTSNTSHGSSALQNNTTGTSNTAVGVNALRDNTTSNNNTAHGSSALQNNTTGGNNTANGSSALLSNTTGTGNTAQGNSALQSNTTGTSNTAVGVSALQSNTTSNNNTAHGSSALLSNTTGSNNTANGSSALLSNTTGGNNTGIGLQAGRTNTTGTSNTFVGFEAGFNASQINSATNSMALGSGTFTTASNQVVIGNTLVTSIGLGMVPATTVKLDLSDTVLAGSGALAGTLLNLAQTWNTSGTPTAIRLNVTDTASAGPSLLIDLRNNGVSRFTVNKSGGGFFAAGLSSGGNITASGIQAQAFNGFTQTRTDTSGTVALYLNSLTGFAPTSGTAVFNNFEIRQNINQTGGASGITRGLFVNPTLTAAADFRAIDTAQGSLIMNDTYLSGSGALDRSLVDLNQTWNTSGSPTAIKLNVTDTASNATSLLMDLQVGGVSRLKITKAGLLTAVGGLIYQGNGIQGANAATSNFTVSGETVAASNSDANKLFAGATTIFNRVGIYGSTSTTIGVNSSYAAFIVGSAPITEAASGTHALLASVVFNPLGTVINAGAAVTNTATLYVNGAGTATSATNYSLWVAGLGASRFDGTIGIGTTTTPVSIFEVGSSDLGSGVAGPVITLGYNTNATPGAGSINYISNTGTNGYVWQDAAGNLRIHTASPSNANDTAGTVVGAQTSTRETKQDIADYIDYDSALALVVNAPLHTFRYIREVEGYGTNSPLAKMRIGYIADEVDPVFMVGNAIDQVSVNGLLIASVKALDIKIQILPVLEDQSLASKIAEFLRGIAENSIAIVDGLKTKKVTTDELCVRDSEGETCLTRSQINQLLGAQTQSIVTPSPTVETIVDIPEVTPQIPEQSDILTEPQPTLEPTPEPTVPESVLE